MQTQNYSINLKKTSMFICMPKINFIIHFILEILHLKQSCNLIGQQRFSPQLENQNFARYRICAKISTTILVFTLGFQKIRKKPYSGAILGPFAEIWAKMNFAGKKSCPFLNIPIIYHCAKNQKKLMVHS